MPMGKLEGHRSAVLRCIMGPNTAFCISASADGRLARWDLETKRPIMFEGHEGPVRSCALSADEELVLSVSDDESTKLWDCRSGTCLASLHFDGPLMDCAWFPDGKRAVVAGRAGLYFLDVLR